MAKTSTAQMCEKLLAYEAAIRGGAKKTNAYKSAGFTGATHKRWLEAHPKLKLPAYVLPLPPQGDVAFSGDGRWLFTLEAGPVEFTLTRYVAATGAVDARTTVASRVETHAWREVLVARSDLRGGRLLFAVTGGVLHEWDVASNQVTTDTDALRSLRIEAKGKSSSSASRSRWWQADFTSDLSHIAYWERGGEGYTLAVFRRSDAKITRYPSIARDHAAAIAFHPTRSLLATLGEHSLLAVIDYEGERVLLEKGLQSHAVAFSLGSTVLCDDWYAKTQRVDYETREQTQVAATWGVLGSQSDRFVTAGPDRFTVYSLARGPKGEQTDFEKIEEVRLSSDGALLAVWADLLCVWNLGTP